MCKSNPLLPQMATIIDVIEETSNIKTFRVVFNDAEAMKNFTFLPGQVGQLTAFGAGEATFVINSSPTRMDYLQFSVMLTGEVTTRLHQLKVGDEVGVRAPLGNGFDAKAMEGKNIVFVGGGIGMAPLRTLIEYILDNREKYGNITILYGARSPQDISYSDDITEWQERGDLIIKLTVDNGTPDWQGEVGLIPNILKEMNPSAENSIAVTCGPPIMIKFTLMALAELGFEDEQILTTLERRMKCGVGLCGRCNIGEKYICVDGPVFSAAELKELPDEL